MTPIHAVHPLFLLMGVLAAVTGLYSIHERAPAAMPWILGASSIAVAARLIQLYAEHRRQRRPDAAIRFDRLSGKDLRAYSGWLKQNVRGHDAAVDHVVECIQRRLELAGSGRTLGAFLLVGPTGTGKTFLGELTAKALYDDEALVLRMNQYKHSEDVFTLLGPPPGYPGYEIGGALTRPVLENPYRVVVLDEFDKSHPDVRHCLYDILDRAHCTEKSSGRRVHFGACVFFATCNTGVESLRSVWEDVSDPLSRAARARDALAREGFDKALLARFDEILLMDRLNVVEVAEVACLQIAKHWRQYGIEVTYAAPEILAEAVRRNMEFNEYGVRQLARLIQDLTTPSIEAARRNGSRRVRLDLDRGTGGITVAAG